MRARSARLLAPLVSSFRRAGLRRAGLRLTGLLVAGLLLSGACSLRRDRSAGSASTGMPAVAPIRTGGTTLTVPQSRPRLWLTPDRIEQARAWLKKNGRPTRDDTPASARALRYLVAGDKDEGKTAVSWLLQFTLDTSGVANDPARWAGEEAMLVFDWCHDLLSADERRTLIERWNGYVDTLNKKEWGGPGLEANNYYWGYLRNSLEWGIVSFHENPRAPEFLQHAIDERYRRGFIPYAQGPGRGGVLGEGTQYGPYVVGYVTIPFVTANGFGLDLWNETEFFKEAVLYLIHATTPSPTHGPGGEPRFELFPFNDDEKWRYGGSGEAAELGMFMGAAAEHWAGGFVGGLAQSWLDLVKPKTLEVGLARGSAGAKPRAFSELPLDYFAAGPSFLYARNKWGADATVLHAQLGRPLHVGHEHVDWGSFQLWRGGRWLTRETVSYGEPIADWRGAPGKQAPGGGAIAHNTLLFEGMGPRTTGHRKGNPQLVRLESRPTHLYAAVDMSDSYRCARSCKKERDENEHAGTVVRELLFVRPLEALVVFDRMQSTDERKSEKEVVKTFVLHTEPRPSVEGNRTLAANGDQALRVWTLLPQKATPRVVQEGGPVGQHRVEVDTNGAELSHFLHVLQARGEKDPDLGVWLHEDERTATVTLSHPAKGIAKVTFEKGEASRGGRFGYVASGQPPLAPLGEGVARMELTDRGPVWR